MTNKKSPPHNVRGAFLRTLAVFHGDELRHLWTFVDARWPNQPVVIKLLDHVCAPARDAADNEDWGVKWNRDSKKVVSISRREVDVGEEFLLVPHDLLHRLSDVAPVGVSDSASNFLSKLAHVGSS